MNYKLTVIVPVFNVEKYINKCLESLADQTLKDIQIIIVNDGSTDKSLEIIEGFMDEFNNNNILLLTKEHGEVSDARNFGMDFIEGEYFTFLDSDDWVTPEAYQKMYEKAIQGDFDIVVCDTNFVYEKKIIQVSSGISCDISSKSMIKKAFKDVFPSVWNKLYKRKLAATDIRFSKNLLFEDIGYTYMLMPYIDSIGVISEPLYQYVQRNDSITYTFNERIRDIITNLDRTIDFYKQRNIMEEYYSELEYVYIRYSYGTFIRRISKTGDIEVFKRNLNFAQSKAREQFPNYKSNKYFHMNGLKGYYLLHFSTIIGYCIFFIEKIKRGKRT